MTRAGFPHSEIFGLALVDSYPSLSQSSTSFIGNIRLGIRCVPLSTFLCIDLTSNWKIPNTCRQSLQKIFLHHKLLNYSASCFERTSVPHLLAIDVTLIRVQSTQIF